MSKKYMIIQLLREKLNEFNFSHEDQKKYMNTKGLCIQCYEELNVCFCELLKDLKDHINELHKKHEKYDENGNIIPKALIYKL